MKNWRYLVALMIFTAIFGIVITALALWT